MIDDLAPLKPAERYQTIGDGETEVRLHCHAVGPVDPGGPEAGERWVNGKGYVPCPLPPSPTRCFLIPRAGHPHRGPHEWTRDLPYPKGVTPARAEPEGPLAPATPYADTVFGKL